MTRPAKVLFVLDVSDGPDLFDVCKLLAQSESIGRPMLRTWVEVFSSKVINGMDDGGTGVIESSMPATPRERWIRKAVTIVVAQPRNECCANSDRMVREYYGLQDSQCIQARLSTVRRGFTVVGPCFSRKPRSQTEQTSHSQTLGRASVHAIFGTDSRRRYHL